MAKSGEKTILPMEDLYIHFDKEKIGEPKVRAVWRPEYHAPNEPRPTAIRLEWGYKIGEKRKGIALVEVWKDKILYMEQSSRVLRILNSENEDITPTGQVDRIDRQIE